MRLVLLSLLVAVPALASPKTVVEKLRKAVATKKVRAIAAALPSSGTIKMLVTGVDVGEGEDEPPRDLSPAEAAKELAEDWVTVGKRFSCKRDCCSIDRKTYPAGKEDYAMSTLSLIEVCVAKDRVTSFTVEPN
jgi:hypothetical protein